MTLDDIDTMTVTVARLKNERDAARVALAWKPYDDDLKRAYSDAVKRYNNAVNKHRKMSEAFRREHTERLF